MNISSVHTTAGFKTESFGNVEPIHETTAHAAGNGGKEEEAIAINHTQKLHAETKRLLDSMQGAETTVERSVHKETNSIMYKIKDKETGKVIREFPEEKLLDMAAKALRRNGPLIDKKI